MTATRQTAEAWRAEAERLLRLSVARPSIADRMRVIAGELLGRPYVSGALIGGPWLEEQMVQDLSAFDCVTLVENVLALARSRSVEGFAAELRQTRYRQGQVAWAQRLHYFCDWMRAQQRRGVLRDRSSGPEARRYRKRLSVLAGYPARERSLTVVPRARLLSALPRIDDGSVVAFASLRGGVDYFHVGLLFWQHDRAPSQKLMLVHASRSVGRVQQEPLSRFLRRNRMRGLSWAAPLDQGA